MLTKKQALELKKQVKTVTDLENIAKQEKLDFSKQEIKDAYDEIMALDENDLADIDGGLVGDSPKRIVRCVNCNERIYVYESGVNSLCYNCLAVNNKYISKKSC